MQQKTYSTGRGTICYWVEPCPSSAWTLVFLPGLTADHTLFDRQIAYFSGRYSILVWDAPGHGVSRPFPLDFSLDCQAQWLHDILSREEVQSFCLIGQSMGGVCGPVLFAAISQRGGGIYCH